MSAYRIRRVGPQHAPVLHGLQTACFTEHWGLPLMTSLMSGPGGRALLAEAGAPPDAVPTGFAVFRIAADEAELLAIGVLEQARRQGLGRALLSAVLDDAAAANARVLFLEAAVDNDAALALYRDLGFEAIGLRPAYYHRPEGVQVDARVMRRTLNAPSLAEPGGA